MKNTMIKIALGATALLLVASMAQPVSASCSPIAAPLTNGTLSHEGSSIYRYNWPVALSYGNCSYASCGIDISYDMPALDLATLQGVFWAIGSGDPTFGPGDDNGSFAVQGWITQLDSPGFYYSANILSPEGGVGWGTGAGIDGCVLNSLTANRCTCMMLTQNGSDGPQFAVFSAKADVSARSEFVYPGNAAIEFCPVPVPEVVNSVRDNLTHDLTMDVRATASCGIYYKDGCDCGVKFLVKEFVRPRGMVGSPGTNDPADFTSLTDSAPQDSGVVDSVQSLCGASNNDVWLATQIVADGVWNSGLVSAPSTKIECGPNLANPDDPQKKKPFPVERPERPTRGGRGGR